MGGCEQSRGEGGRLDTPLKAKSAISPQGTTSGYTDAFQTVEDRKSEGQFGREQLQLAGTLVPELTSGSSPPLWVRNELCTNNS